MEKDGVAISGATASSLTLTNVGTGNAGTYTVVVSNSGGATTSSAASLTINAPAAIPAISQQPQSLSVGVGTNAVFSVSASGNGLSYQWQRNGLAIGGATGSSITVTNAWSGAAGDYSVVVTSTAGAVASAAATLTVRSVEYFGTLGSNGGTFALFIRPDRTGAFLGYARASKIAFVTKDILLDAAGRFRFSTTVGASPTGNSAAIHPLVAASAEYVIEGAIGGDGSVSGVISGLGLSLAAPPPTLTGSTSSAAGFYESGAVGSSATSYTIIGATGDVYVATMTAAGSDAGKGTIDTSGAMNVTTENNARVSGTVDANAKLALSTTPSGSNTAIVFSGGNTDSAAKEKLINVSTRAFAGAGDNTLIAGFTVLGSSPKRVLIRGIGPTLIQYGVSTALAHPQLKLFSGQTMIAQNTGWSSSADAAAIVTTSAQVGAFPLVASSQDAVLLLYVAPGGYTAQVSSTDGATGVAMIEVYEVP